MTRSEWLELRSEYLHLQKANLAQLKSSLKASKQTNPNQTAGLIQVNFFVVKIYDYFIVYIVYISLIGFSLPTITGFAWPMKMIITEVMK